MVVVPDPLAWLGTRRRAVLAVCLALALVVAGISYVRIADVHDPVEWESIDTDGDPQAVVDEVNRQLFRVDHRTETRVWLVDDAGTRRFRAVYEDAYDYSDRQFLARYAGPVPAAPTVAVAKPIHHDLLANALTARGNHTLFYATDGRYAMAGWDAPPRSPTQEEEAAEDEAAEDEAAEDEAATVPTTARVTRGNASVTTVLYGARFFQPDHTAAWRVVDRNASAVTYGVDDPGEYAKTRSLRFARAVHPGSSIRLTVDAATGRPLVVRERRVVTRQLTVEHENGTYSEVDRRLEFVVVTRFSDFETLDVTRPAGVDGDPPTLRDFFWDFLRY